MYNVKETRCRSIFVTTQKFLLMILMKKILMKKIKYRKSYSRMSLVFCIFDVSNDSSLYIAKKKSLPLM